MISALEVPHSGLGLDSDGTQTLKNTVAALIFVQLIIAGASHSLDGTYQRHHYILWSNCLSNQNGVQSPLLLSHRSEVLPAGKLKIHPPNVHSEVFLKNLSSRPVGFLE